MNDKQQIYASVDLELSGFDPEADGIIEIGILRFCAEAGALTVIDSWGSLVRPTAEIRSRVLGLTGIDSVEASAAPQWAEVLPKVQELLGEAIILGHGVDLDRKFLEAKGVVLLSKTIDTLELAQIFLPTHHSYNLENLAHELQVVHTTAHRALADAEATYGVLEQLIGVYQGLPKNLQKTIQRIAELRHIEWAALFAAVTHAVPVKIAASGPIEVGHHTLPVLRSSGMVVTAPGEQYLPNFEALRTHIPTWVVALAERERVLALAKHEHVEPYLGAFESVSPRALEELHDKLSELGPREITAYLKVLVWQARESSHGILAELNWSIIGTELKRLFTNGFISRVPLGVAVSDFRSLPDFKDGRNVWIEQADSYIQFLEQKSGMQVSWNSMLTALRQVYNPETGFGDAARSKDIIEAIAQVDVFYARVLLLFKQELHLTSGVVSPDYAGAYVWSRITQAAENVCAKLRTLFERTKETSINRITESLSAYFSQHAKETEVRWVEFSDNRCVFVLRPVELTEVFRQSTAQKKEIVLQTDVRNSLLQSYFVKRLGFSSTATNVSEELNAPIFQRELTVIDESVELEVSRRLAGIQNGIIIFPTLEKLKNYYDLHYAKLTAAPAVAAVGVHGGANKVLRNFSHSKKTIVLAALPSLVSFLPFSLSLSHVLFADLPLVDVRHPYQSKLAKQYFPDEQSYKSHIQLLHFIQTLRVFNTKDLAFLELMAQKSDEQTAKFIFDEVFG